MLKIGGGTPPILTRHGWLMVYHGVSEVAEPGSDGHHLCYSAGVMVLSKEHPRRILHRSEEPVLTPQMPQEGWGVVSNVVFPTGIDRRDDLGSPDRIDVYYGMADKRIGVARLDVPERLPSGALANGRDRKSKFPSAANRKEDLRRTTGSCDCGEQHRDGAEHRTGIPAMGQTTRVQE
jgi:hypothetical protein